MKNVCESCQFAKLKNGCYCTKYGIPVYQPRMYCIAYERRKNETNNNSVIDARAYFANKHS